MSSIDLLEIVIVSMALVTEGALYRVVPGKEPWVQIPGYSIHLTIDRVQGTDYRVHITGYRLQNQISKVRDFPATHPKCTFRTCLWCFLLEVKSFPQCSQE